MKIAQRIPIRIRLFLSRIIRLVAYKTRLWKINASRDRNPIFFVLNVPSHGNMGDQLIACAVQRFLDDYYPKARKEFFTTGELECGIEHLRPIVLLQDIIFITGGGFLGDLYSDEEKRFHDVLRLFSANKIIMLPQTFFYYENSARLQEAIYLHEKCKNLIISTRETRSYEYIKKHFIKARVLLLPDMTTYLNSTFMDFSHNRNGICICSRKDNEMLDDSKNLFDEVVNLASTNNITIRYLDTQLPYCISPRKRDYEIKKFLRILSSCKMVVTDRLHGMLFSIISGTPVIAIDNITHKVSGAYNDWFVNLPYVSFCSNISQIRHEMHSLYQMSGQQFENESYIDLLKTLLDYVET